MDTPHFIVATAGHVDHGKSSLVKALTGIDPDRLPEEKARGITIDLGFAHLSLPASDGPTPGGLYSLGIVDVPGHEDFVKNMVAGVGLVDLALLVVAADDGWMPQTEEHLQILTYLSVKHAVVALTKADLAGDQLELVTAELQEKLRDTPFVQAPIVPTSVLSGLGLETLKLALARTFSGMEPSRDIGKPRLPVDRAFSLQGIGTVVTGSLAGGILKRGDAVVVQPSGRSTRVRALQSHNQEVERIGPGTRTAVNLPDLAAGDRAHGSQGGEGIARGDVLTVPGLGAASAAWDVRLDRSSRLREVGGRSARPMKQGTLVRIHHGSANWAARVHFLAVESLSPGESALAEFRLETPGFVFAGDRFIVRDWSEQSTLGGGVVLDPDAERGRFRTESQRRLLEGRASALEKVEVWVRTQVERDQSVVRETMLRKSNFSASEIAGAIASLGQSGALIVAGDRVMDAVWWQGLRNKAGELVRAELRAHPERPGLDLTELRRALKDSLRDESVFGALLADLGAHGFTQSGTTLKHASHQPALPPHLQAAGVKLRAALQSKPLEPPTKKELLAIPQGAEALRFLVHTGEAVDLGEETVLAMDHFQSATRRIREFLRQRGPATASELRQMLNTNRRVIIPLLERLDRDGVTVRQGDKRTLKP